jgi:hypothetical protein
MRICQVISWWEIQHDIESATPYQEIVQLDEILEAVIVVGKIPLSSVGKLRRST